MSLIDTSYFIGPLNIAGLSSQHIRAKVDGFIEIYEPEFLSLVFGALLYADYIAGIAEDPIDEIWTALQSAEMKSALACYVYFYYMRDQETTSTTLGETKQQTENSTPVSSISKQVYAWNRMVVLIRKVYDYLDLNNVVYANWTTDYRYGYYDARNVYHKNYLIKPINVLNV